jgi:hypothetical protein
VRAGGLPTLTVEGAAPPPPSRPEEERFLRAGASPRPVRDRLLDSTDWVARTRSPAAGWAKYPISQCLGVARAPFLSVVKAA